MKLKGRANIFYDFLMLQRISASPTEWPKNQIFTPRKRQVADLKQGFTSRCVTGESVA